MKRFLAALAALVCVLGLSVTSLAYNKISPGTMPFLVKSGDHYKLSFTVPISEQSQEVQSAWQVIMSGFVEHSSVIPICNYSLNSDGSGFLQFRVLPSGSTYSFSQSALSGSSALVGSMVMNPSSSMYCVNLLFDSNMSITGMTQKTYSSSSTFYVSNYTYNSMSYKKGIVWAPGVTNIPSYANVVDIDSFLIEDDLEDPVPEEPSEPDTPSSSSTGGWTPPVVADPEIPVGDEYVFYDTAVLKDFLRYVRDAIGKAINVGWLIFGFILMWLIIKKVIKSFSSR